MQNDSEIIMRVDGQQNIQQTTRAKVPFVQNIRTQIITIKFTQVSVIDKN